MEPYRRSERDGYITAACFAKYSAPNLANEIGAPLQHNMSIPPGIYRIEPVGQPGNCLQIGHAVDHGSPVFVTKIDPTIPQSQLVSA